ncbi:C39 family peptidase [Neobacillus niacini]|uniref:C39 family peptidase n=1 Tax=Neobacillus niacini TaxID=86668 RepID=UPI00069412B0|nr:C39 family peptidase [Neobacillus niacini]
MKKVVICGFSLIILCFSILADVGTGRNEEKAVATPFTKVVLAEEIQLDVPLLNQMDSPRLYNGCEVTSLAMLLQYWGIDVTKNKLAEQIPRVPLQYGDGKKGNPNMGFVGNMEDGPGLGVYQGPIFYLANKHISEQLMVQNLSNHPFSSILKKVSQGLPVWVITTSSFSPIPDFETWSTPQGTVGITYKMHSVVITGYDQEYIYLNDPYGTKNKKVDREKFIASWEQMGSQAIVIERK